MKSRYSIVLPKKSWGHAVSKTIGFCTNDQSYAKSRQGNLPTLCESIMMQLVWFQDKVDVRLIMITTSFLWFQNFSCVLFFHNWWRTYGFCSFHSFDFDPLLLILGSWVGPLFSEKSNNKNSEKNVCACFTCWKALGHLKLKEASYKNKLSKLNKQMQRAK